MNEESAELINDVVDLTADYTFARYPDVAEHIPHEEYDADVTRVKVEKARRIFEVIKERYKALEDER